jgi:UDP-GlcNAc:undecaprenyl-phosphate GlcNAc-1-phosphate transferase
MNQAFYLMPMLVSFALCVCLLLFLIFLSSRSKFAEKRLEKRHVHVKGVSRLGGVAIILAFLLTLFFDDRLIFSLQLFAVCFACLAILIFGLLDDFKQLSWREQLFFQVSLIAFVLLMGVRIQYLTNPFGDVIVFSSGLAHLVGFFIGVLWVVFLMNAMNWVDGIDGVSGGITLIASLSIFILSLRPEVNQPPIGIITAALVGCLAAFLLLNFHPAKIMAGTSGSMFMGFILAILAIFAGAKIATTLLVLAVPIIDALWVIGERWNMKKSIFIADKRHLHYRLLELGWSAKRICFFYYTVTGFFAIVALSTKATGKLFSLVVFSLGIVGILFVIRRKTTEKKTQIV